MTNKLRAAGVLTVLALALTGCGGEKVGEAEKPAGGGKECGTVNLTVSPWVGYEANAAVVAYVATKDLGCKVVKKNLKEEIAWQGFGTGEIDVNLENWGHEDLKKKYITDQKVAVEATSTGNKGVIGWYLPPWLAAEKPELKDWNTLNKNAALFKTSESGGKGQLLDGDPSFVTNDEALVKNLKLDYKVVYAGSETALIQAFRDAEKNKKPVIGYFYEPQWFFNELKLVKVDLPAYSAKLRRGSGEGGLRLPGVRAGQDRLEEVRRLRQPGVRAGEEVQLDERRPERGGEVHRRGQDDPGCGRREVGQGQPVQGRRLAR